MSKLIQMASQALLTPSAVNEQQLETILGRAMGKHIDHADIYLQSIQSESWVLEDSIVKEGDYSVDRGFGLRVISGEKVGFAYADSINNQALIDAACSAKSIVHSSQQQSIQVPTAIEPPQLYSDVNPLQTITDQEKVALLQKVDHFARQMDPRIKRVIVTLAGSYEVVLILDSEGQLAADLRPLVRLNVRVIAEEKGRREQGVYGAGGRFSYEKYLSETHLKHFAQKAVDQALINLNAKPAPAGTMPVVLGPGWPAVLLHEAVGHGLEGDFNRKGTSAFAGCLGQQVASSLCTIVDDGAIAQRRGSLTIDDEGTPGQKTMLIEQGILKNYMQDKHNAHLMKMKPTGNGRRESYAHKPLPRMTNTYMLPGTSDPQEIIASVRKGIYAVDFAGGQVDITSGKFVFSMSEAYLIENGKVTHPIKGATLIGSGPEVLKQVTMVGNDLALDNGIGVCGKAGQSVPVGVGQPTLKIDRLTVGGGDSTSREGH